MAAESQVVQGASDWSSMESRIVQSLKESTNELAHAECFDEEQRAEIYTILDALRSDTEIHQQAIERLACRGPQGEGHA